MSSIVSFYQGLALVQVSSRFHMLGFHGVYTYPIYEELKHDSNFQSHEKRVKS